MSYTIYIDESYDRNSKYLVMAGCITPHNSWKSMDEGIRRLKTNYLDNPYVNMKKIRRSKHEMKERFFEGFYSLLNKSNFLVVASLINKEKMGSQRKELNFKLAYSFLLERYEHFLEDSGQDNFGIVIMDRAKNSAEINQLVSFHDDILKDGIIVAKKRIPKDADDKSKVVKLKDILDKYKRKPVKRIIESLIFQDDTNNNFLQAADCISSAISQKFNRNNDRYYEQIEGIIRRDPETGMINGYGIKIFPMEE